MTTLAGPAELREVVRDVVREVVAALERPASSPPTVVQRTVSITTDAELAAFVGDLLRLFDVPGDRRALREGRLRYRLAPPPASASPSANPPPADPPSGEPVPREPAVRRVERGAVTERQVADAAGRNLTLLLGRRAVLTPLAREKARELGVVIEKEPPC
ncbi:hypothetical protein [Actinomadura sp. 3N407]|uniref:hypothetical protein n=1 Tax=Actinomadura sp. 3N407 TaxID=3457423 RepID=UPI003FCC8298